MNNDKTNEIHPEGKHKNKRRPYYNKKKHRRNNDGNKENNEILNKDETVKELNQDKELDNSALLDADMIFEAEYDMTPTVTVAIDNQEEDVKKVHVTGVRFKPGGKVYYFGNNGFDIKDGSYVIVDTARGLEFGEVSYKDIEVKESSVVLPLRSIVRKATEKDIEHNKDNRKKEEEAFKICLEKIKAHSLDMKLIEAQYSFDNSKLLFYFTSASRVDFRELVKDLAGVFKTRIELRQIGIRDEAKLMGGLGACGRPLCCSTFLSDFVQVSIKMAKEQNLSLNSGKISGCCGRLMCCLQYEYKTYCEESAKTPPVDSVVKTKEGIGTVTEMNALAGTVKVKLKDKPDMAPILFKRDDVTIISKPAPQKEQND